MRAPPARTEPMASAEFLAWAREQPEGERYGLVAGEVVAMPPQGRAGAIAARSLERGRLDLDPPGLVEVE